MSITPLLVLALGIIIGVTDLVPSELLDHMDSLVKGFVILLCFVIGMDMGKDKRLWSNIRNMGHKAVVIPLTSVAGSLIGGIAAGLLVGIPPAVSSAASAGSGYYSLTTILLKQLAGPEAATIAFISNMARELLVMTAMPVLVAMFGKNGAVGVAGATAMDTSLPFIVKSAGRDMAIAAFVSGVILTIVMPVMVPVCYRFFLLFQ